MSNREELDLNRLWDALVSNSPIDVDAADRRSTEAIHRLHAAQDVPGADPTFVTRLWEDLMYTSPTQAVGALAPPQRTGLQIRKLKTTATRLAPFYGPSREYRPWQLAVIAMTIIAVIGVVVSLARLIDLNGTTRSPAGIVVLATPAAQSPITEQVLVTLPLSADLLPRGSDISSGLTRFSVPAGTTATWSEPCCAGPLVEYVLAGTYTVHAEDAVTVYRSTGAIEEVTRGTSVTLTTGDALLSKSETLVEVSADASGPVDLLSWMLIDISGPFQERKLDGWTRVGQPGYVQNVDTEGEGMEFVLRKVTAPSGSVLELPAGRTGIQLALPVDVGDGFIANLDDGSLELRSQSGDPASFFVIAVTETFFSDGTPQS